MRFAALLALAASLVGGCAVDDQPPVPYEVGGSIADFSTYVQPVLQAGCASLDCHGLAGRPLRLYAQNGLRLAVGLRGEGASDAELRANMNAIAGLEPAVDRVEDHLLLLKPLSVEAGGIHHIGGDLWIDQNDLAYRCLHAWLRAGAGDAAGQAICDQASP